MHPNITWMGHDCFAITSDSRTIFTDPFQLRDQKRKADIILVTHSHYDHCSPEDIARVASEKTIIVAPPDCAEALAAYDVRTVQPGSILDIGNIHLEAVPAYNTNKPFHPKANNWVGYIFTVDGTRIYLAGDTDRIPEMKNFQEIDIALLPVSGTYVMTAEEAVQAALDISPKLAIPMHYGGIVGTVGDAESFQKGLAGKLAVTILHEA